MEKNVYVILLQTKTFVVGRNLTSIQVLMNVNRLGIVKESNII